MAFKINILPDIETDMERLIKLMGLRSKTEYINQALADFNAKITRALELDKLKKYFSTYHKHGKNILHEFAAQRKISH